MKQNPKSHFQRCTTLHNVDTMLVSDVETTLIQVYLGVVSTWSQGLNFNESYIETNGASDKYECVNR